MQNEQKLLRSDYYYDLPEELIAQDPAQKRDESRLFLLDRKSGEYHHKHFFDIKEYIKAGDILVVNNSKVIPARLLGNRFKKDASGKYTDEKGSAIELLLLERKSENTWEALSRPGHKTPVGTKLTFGDGKLLGEIIEVCEGGNRIVKFDYEGEFMALLDTVGEMPLPPYIHKKAEDKNRYQTVYARHDGSAAAPTAGLHFTKELMAELESMGVVIVPVTLHVGLGTFRPVKEDDITKHKMHSEFCTVSADAAEKYNAAKKKGGRVFAVGTTSCRTLESCADENGCLSPCEKYTDIFIYPGYKFKAVDSLITNFHLPESTLLMLISALAGRETVLDAYKCAVEEKYRFFSFGDAMLIL
jgi:S-adenosylmethionine:tRNA ribosyltransferase-isomerase